MFTPFTLEEGLLDSGEFLQNETQFNVMHRIVEDPEALRLKSTNGKLLAVQNRGRNMWLWLSESLDESKSVELTEALAVTLRENKLPGIAARPVQAKAFADRYSALTGATYKEHMTIESYECPVVNPPQSVMGRRIAPREEHVDLVAEFCVGFIQDGFDKTVSKESQMETAKNLTSSGNLYLWEVNGTVVCMAYIASRSKRQARINYVYTPPEQRKNGYASALVAEMSQLILDEGRTPILFADVLYPASNKVYRNIGYKERGRITELAFTYEA